MQKSRPKSASADSRASNKPTLTRRWKERSGNHSVLVESTISHDINDAKSVKSKASSKRRSNSVIIDPKNTFELDNDFHKTSKLLAKTNFSHHNPELCVCSECTCGRHMCKLHSIAPDLTKASVYQKQFPKKQHVENKVYIAKEYDKLDGPHLNLSSTKGKDFTPKANDDLHRPKPEDLLKTGGPCPNLSSYAQDFPGHHGDNQYVKPTDKHTRGYFPLRGKSTYNGCFKGEPKPKSDWDGIKDNLKLGGGWFGDTTNRSSFKAPKQTAYPPHVKVVEKRQINPDDKNQFGTSYKKQFSNKGNVTCQAKVLMETVGKGLFKDSKLNFNENTDFKAFSPNFKTMASGKFSYAQP